jgi:hypothetical protein
MASAVIALIWLGMLIGVSFIATPAKFAVRELTRPVALQVGRATFSVFTRIEWTTAAALLFACALDWRTRPLALVLTLCVAACVLAQATWLLPVLGLRVATIASGEEPRPSTHHRVYAALEAAKAGMLAAVAVLALR